MNDNNLGSRWILKNLKIDTEEHGGSITQTDNIEAKLNQMYTGILEIDTSDDPDVNTSNTNFVYDNTTIFLSTMSYNSNYFIMLTW